MINRFQQVDDGLFRGSAPNVQDVIDLHKYLDVNKIVSLDQEAGNRIDRICKLLNVNHVIIPVNANQIEPLMKLLSFDLTQLLMDGGPTFIHCRQGKDRTGMVIAMYKCKYLGVPCDKAIKEAKSLGFGHGLKPSITKSYEKMIRMCCSQKHNHESKDINELDIVNNTRPEASFDEKTIEEATMPSWGPQLDFTRMYPFNSEFESVPLIDGTGPTANIGTGFVEV